MRPLSDVRSGRSPDATEENLSSRLKPPCWLVEGNSKIGHIQAFMAVEEDNFDLI